MMQDSVIRVFEHEKLTLHEDHLGRYLTDSELARLYDYNDRHDNIYFTGIRDGIKFKNYVGVIQIGRKTIEILPKTDKKIAASDKECQDWQRVLLRMLASCQFLNVVSISEAALERRYNSLLDLYFNLFLEEVKNLIHKGLIKKYRKSSGNLKALKGRIVFPQHLRKNLIHKERIFTEHQVYDHEHLYNQVLYRALVILSNVSRNTNLEDMINRLKLDFPEIENIKVNKCHFDKLKINRKTKPYQNALNIAKMIILNYSPDIRSGEDDMLALLFDMNKLWEEYIYRMLVQEKENEYKVSFQNSEPFWKNKSIQPDLVLSKDTGEVTEKVIIDTKWKIIEKNDPSDSDLKQMFAYNMYWNATKSILLYPASADGEEEEYGLFHKGKDNGHYCKLGFISVLNEHGELDRGIGKRVLEKISNERQEKETLPV